MSLSSRAHAADLEAMDRELLRHRERFANSYRVLTAIGAKIRRLPSLELEHGYGTLELQADAVFDLMEAGRDLPEDVADVLVEGYGR